MYLTLLNSLRIITVGKYELIIKRFRVQIEVNHPIFFRICFYIYFTYIFLETYLIAQWIIYVYNILYIYTYYAYIYINIYIYGEPPPHDFFPIPVSSVRRVVTLNEGNGQLPAADIHTLVTTIENTVTLTL